MKILVNNPEVDIVINDYDAIDPNDEIKGYYKKTYDDHFFLKFHFLFKNTIHHSGNIIRVNNRTREHLYEKFIIGEDFDLWKRLIYDQGLIIRSVPEYLSSYRRHGN